MTTHEGNSASLWIGMKSPKMCHAEVVDENRAIALSKEPGIPVAITAEWTAKRVVSRVPEPREWVERSLQWVIEADAPLVAAVLLSWSGHFRFGRLPAEAVDRQITVRLGFSRYRPAGQSDEWPTEKEVLVGLYQRTQYGGAGLQTVVVSNELYEDPRTVVRTFDTDAAATTRMLIPLAVIPEVAVRASVILFSRSEVSVSHDRWRVRPDVLGSTERFSFLLRGARTGEVFDEETAS